MLNVLYDSNAMWLNLLWIIGWFGGINLLLHFFTIPSKQSHQWMIGLLWAIFWGCMSPLTVYLYTHNLFFESDFSDYCISVLSLDTGAMMPPKRTRLAAWFSWLFLDFGIANALAISAWLGHIVMMMALFVWGFAQKGFRTGLWAVGLASLMTPLIMMSRFLTFYPSIVWITVFAAAMIACLQKWQNPLAATLTGIGVGLCLLIDVRGVVWALPFWIGAILLIGKEKMGWWSLLALHLPIWGSWFLARWSYSPYSSSLEKQLDVRPLYVGFDEDNPLFQPPWNIDSHFIWGWSKPQDFGHTLLFIWEQRNYSVPPAFLVWQDKVGLQAQYYDFWWILLLLALPTVLWQAKERWLGLLIAIAPFLVIFHSLSTMVEQHIRFYMHPLPAFAVILALLLGDWKVERISDEIRRKLSKFRYFSSALGIFLWAVFIWGSHRWSISPASYQASWRNQWTYGQHEFQAVSKVMKHSSSSKRSNGSAYVQECAQWIQNEEMEILPTIYPK